MRREVYAVGVRENIENCPELATQPGPPSLTNPLPLPTSPTPAPLRPQTVPVLAVLGAATATFGSATLKGLGSRGGAPQKAAQKQE